MNEDMKITQKGTSRFAPPIFSIGGARKYCLLRKIVVLVVSSWVQSAGMFTFGSKNWLIVPSPEWKNQAVIRIFVQFLLKKMKFMYLTYPCEYHIIIADI